MSRELVTTTEGSAPPPERVLLRPCPTPARTGPQFQQFCDWRDISAVSEAARASQFLALDFETKGGDYSDSIEIVGLGLAWDTGSVYFDWGSLLPVARDKLWQLVLEHPGLLAHNVYFDGGVVRALTGLHAKWASCTYAGYKLLSNEGWTGQKWGLKEAQMDILQWADSNEHELDDWLVSNNHYIGNRRTNESPEALLTAFREGTIRPAKAEMWRAPVEVLGKYCILDAEACYLLHTEHLLPAAQSFPEYQEFEHEFLHLILLHIDQKLHGLLVDRPALEARRDVLLSEISHQTQHLLNHPELEPHIRELESSLLAELTAKEPPQFLKQKVRPPEPPRLRKDGEISKNWLKWVENESKYSGSIGSKNWDNWRVRMDRAIAGELPEYRFNLQSDHQLRELLYGRLGMEVRIQTDSGQPATGIKALKHMGEVGKLLIERAWKEKELGYIADYIERTEQRSTIHPSFRMPGTKTGRLSSGGPNLQQIPKSKAVMSLFVARPGYTLVDLDFSALEPTVTTEFSGDVNMQLIYGNGRPANDIYLFVGAHIPGMDRKIRDAGYHPTNPTPQGLAAAKRAAKHERSICKTVTLACQYGAGINKVMATLEADDIFLPHEEVEKIHSTYWDLFSGVRQFSWDLQRQWKRNGGYILNGIGRPMCLTEDYKHDCLNRFIQSTGHDILVRYVYILARLLDDAGIQWYPYVVDWHDSCAVEVPDGCVELVIECYQQAMCELNRQLGGKIELKGTPSWGKDMSAIKEPEE